MSRLFDTSTQEPERKKARRPAPEPPAAVPEPAAVALPTVALPYLGRLDEGVRCLDQTCQAEAHDITDEYRGQWRLECAFCGTGQWAPVVRGHLPEPPVGGDFMLLGGRFGGYTIAEAAETTRGMDYIRWAAAEHPRLPVKKACETYLASLSASR